MSDEEIRVSREQAIAGVRVLIAVAYADGYLSFVERDALEPVFDNLELDADERRLLTEDRPKLEAAIQAVTDPEVRRQVAWAAHAVAKADQGLTRGEKEVIDRLREAWELDPKELGPLDALLERLRDRTPEEVATVADPAARRAKIDALVRGRSVMLGALGLFPPNGATELITGFVQYRMVRAIGVYHGYEGESEIARALWASLIGLVVVNLGIGALIRLVPVWGSAYGAAANFTTTFGLGFAADQYFASGGKLDKEALRDALKGHRKAGETAYQEEKTAVAAKAEEKKGSVEELALGFNRGELDDIEIPFGDYD